MKTEVLRKCKECGKGKIRPTARAGRSMPYRNMKALEIPADFLIPTCDKCGAEWIDESTAEALDEALEKAYRRILRERVKKAIDVIAKYVSQKRLESLLGISQGYLSRLRSGERDPSPELVSNLVLISRDPAARVEELEQLWGEKQVS